MRGLLFIVSGPSGVGKGTICRQLVERRPQIKVSVSCTARAPRPGEIDGVHYFFISEAEFDRMAENDEFLECANVHGRRYGTPRAYVEKMLSQGHDVILEIDVQGGHQVMAKGIPLTSVFVLPPSYEALIERLTGRGTEGEEQIRLRLKNSAHELLAAEGYDFLLVNDDLEVAIGTLSAIIDAMHSARENNSDCLTALYKEIKEDKNHDD